MIAVDTKTHLQSNNAESLPLFHLALAVFSSSYILRFLEIVLCGNLFTSSIQFFFLGLLSIAEGPYTNVFLHALFLESVFLSSRETFVPSISV